MATIAQVKKLLDVTPLDQALMLRAIHGVGKSEFIRDHYKAQGYEVVTLFLGQMSDAGDLIGLPDRTDVVFEYEGQKVTQKITEFCPPKWWRFNKDAKLVLFLDEFNRGKPDVYQCVFDMVLNRKLNGFELPTDTRIIAAVNPIESATMEYDVRELDPALMDRFNVYDFNPSVEEWIDWAAIAGVHPYIIKFINKNRQFLDPETKNETDQILPSRRSWKRVSDTLNAHKEMISGNDMEMLHIYMAGVVGIGATAKFLDYVKNEAKKISASRFVHKWDKEIEAIIKQMSNQEHIFLNKELQMYLEENEKDLFDFGEKQASAYAHNVYKYMKCIHREVAAEFLAAHVCNTSSPSKNKGWAKKLLDNCPDLASLYIDVISGKTEFDKKQEKTFAENVKGADPEIKDDDDDVDPDIQSEIDDLCK